MTIDQIHEKIKDHRACSRRQIIRWMDNLGICPVGIRQRPQQFPESSAEMILESLGVQTVKAKANGTGWKTRRALVTMPALRKARKEARGK